MKSILLLVQNSDSAVDEVMLWLKLKYSYPIIIISSKDKIDSLTINQQIHSSKFTFKVNNQYVVNSNDILAYYYRRGELPYNHVFTKHKFEKESINNKFHTSINSYYLNEWEHLTDYIHYLLNCSNIPSLNSYFDLRVNKLINIDLAKNMHMKTPDSIISNDINCIRAFIEKHKKVIAKPIRNPGSGFSHNGIQFGYSQPSSIYTLEMLDMAIKCGAFFQPSLFQEYIEKEFEIRCYYMKGTCYSMAIFSQNNEKTKIDFRNYDLEKPNRNVPFKLPINIEKNIDEFMKYLNFDTGSLDFIYGNGSYTFLEVNTVGQFSWLSYNCNYYIEQKISELIIEYATKSK